MEKDKKILLIIGIVILVVAAAGVYFFIALSKNVTNTNVNANLNQPVVNQNTNAETNTNTDENENVNQTSAITTEEVTVQGMVFLKGYKTPSESYGVLTTDGHEIGLGKYDTMKEQFRAYIGEKVNVTFESICRSINQDCCRTLFYYCGTVKSWTPVENTNTQ